MLSDLILSADDQLGELYVPEWRCARDGVEFDGRLFLRPWTQEQRVQFYTLHHAKRDEMKDQWHPDVLATAIVYSAVDADGQPLFADEQTPALAAKRYDLILWIGLEAMTFAGLFRDGVKAAKKK